MTLLDAIADANLLGSQFPGETWMPWFAFLAAVDGRALDAEGLELYQRATGRQQPPETPAREVVAVVGRRGGKSRVAAALAIEAACFRDWTPHLAPGEVATVAVIAADKAQARTTFGYICGMIESVPMLGQLVTRRRAHSIELAGRVRIEVTTCSARTTRGYTFACVIADELAFWKSETTSEPDKDVLDAVRPGMATLPGSRLVCISSPHGKWGALYDAFAEHYGREGDPVLVWQCDTAGMNPSVDPTVIEQAYERDPAVAGAEYGAQFRDDVAVYLDRARIEALVVSGRVSIPPLPDRTYLAACDMSGGASDSAALAIAHREGDRAVLDLVVERRAPHDPGEVTREFCALLRQYHTSTVTGDAYASAWCSGAYADAGVSYASATLSKSECYRDFVPIVMTGAVELPDDRVLVTQLCRLERRVARGSTREVIDHPRGARDDVANVVALVAVLTASVGTSEPICTTDFSHVSPGILALWDAANPDGDDW